MAIAAFFAFVTAKNNIANSIHFIYEHISSFRRKAKSIQFNQNSCYFVPLCLKKSPISWLACFYYFSW
jgi:hypothetical protein